MAILLRQIGQFALSASLREKMFDGARSRSVSGFNRKDIGEYGPGIFPDYGRQTLEEKQETTHEA